MADRDERGEWVLEWKLAATLKRYGKLGMFMSVTRTVIVNCWGGGIQGYFDGPREASSLPLLIINSNHRILDEFKDSRF